MGKYRRFLLRTSIGLILFCLPLSAFGADKVTLQLIWKNQFQFAGYYVAREMGFYDDAGLDVTIKEYEFGMDVTADVVSQRADFGVGRSSLILESMEGKPVFLLSAIFQQSPFMLLAKKREDLKEVADLKGKRIMVTDDVVGMASLTAMLTGNGIRSGDYISQKHTFSVEDLISGKTDAIAAYTSNEPFQMQKRGLDYKIFSPKDHGFDFYSDILFTSQKIYQDNPQLVERFHQASLRGWEYAFGHINDAVEIILKKYNTQNRDKEALRFEADTLKTLAYDGDASLGRIARGRVEQIAQVYRLLGFTTKPLNMDYLIFSPKDNVHLPLDPEERAWLNKHHTVKARVGQAPPLHFFDGKFRGISVDYLNLIAKRAGFKVQYVTDIPWSNALDHIKNHEVVDLLLTAKATPERRGFMAFTKDYLFVPWVIFTQKDSSVDTIEALTNKTVSVEQNFVMHKKLATEYPGIKLLVKETSKKAIEAVATGQADAYIGNLTTGAYIIQQNNFINLKISAPTPFDNHNQAMAIRNDWPELTGIINKTFDSISPEEHTAIRKKWFSLDYGQGVDGPKMVDISPGTPGDTLKPTIVLAPEERAWLDEHPVIRVVNDKNYPPYDFFRNGRAQGFSVEYLELLAKIAGLRIKWESRDDWDGAVEDFKNKKVDALHSARNTEDRKAFTLFTKPYFHNLSALFIRKDNSTFDSVGDLSDSTVAIPRGYADKELIQNSYPESKIVETDGPREALKMVALGEADVTSLDVGVGNFLILELGLDNLKISTYAFFSQTKDENGFFIGVRNDWPELVSILNKAIDSIDVIETQKLKRKWLGSPETAESPIDLTLAPQTASPISYGRLIAYGIAVFLILSLLTWILIKTIKKEQIAVSFGSTWFRGLVLAGLSLFVLIVAFVGWYMLERNKTEHLLNVDENLRGIISVSADRFDLWLKERISYVARLGRDPELVAITQRLLQVKPNKRALLASGALREARFFFKNTEDIFGNIGFFVINPDHVSIGSMRDANLGSRNLISKQNPELLQRAFQGKVGFVPPMTSDVDLGSTAKSDNAKKPPTMFFIGPVQDTDGRILAVMTLRVDPWKDFARALKSFGGGVSRESYAFDRHGVMLSSSRFEDQLRRIGLLAEDQASALNIEIRDPGGNMVEGYRPDIERSQQPLTQLVTRILSLRQQMESAEIRQGHSPVESNIEGYRDYRGVPVFGAWLWNADLDIGLAVEVDVAEALSHYYRTRLTIFSILGFTLLLSVGAILFVLIIGERTSRALMKSRDNLEAKVDERTAELQEKQKQLEAAVERSGLLLDSAGEGIFGVDLAGKVAFINPAATRMLGYRADELIGKEVHEQIHHSHADGSVYPKSECPMYLTHADGTDHHIADEVLWRKDGSSFPVEYTSMPIKKNGQVVGAVVTFMDITERKQMEQEILTAKEKAEEATRAKSDFLANMSHEIRTPMNAVIGMSHLAQKTELTAKQQDYLNKIQSSANSLLGIINDILDFSKIEAGKLDMESTEFNLDDVLDNLANLVTVKAQEKEDLEVLFATDQKVPRFLVGDPLRLGQVLINLANNAVKFTESGEIVVATELLAQAETGLTIKFSVRDTGIGLTKDQIGKLFQSFSQADTSTTRKFGGTGLGLTISKRLVNMMGGEIWVESEPGQGTTFSFSANFGLGRETVKKRLVPSSDLRGMKVLVVDDSATSRNILQDILESFSFEVTLAASAEEGLEEILKADTDHPYELVLMDWKMPGMDGLEASDRIKNHQALSKIPAIILVTAYGREEIMQQAEQIGLDGFLIKPISPSVLFDTIMQALGEGIPKTTRAADRNKEIVDLKDIQGAQVLLVEDNEINQQVAKEILAGGGLNVTVANDGQEAVNAVRDSDYDAVLMDIQMPVMDGYTATRKIREWERRLKAQGSRLKEDERVQKSEIKSQKPEDKEDKTEYSHQTLRPEPCAVSLPIIAMTAHAMAGDEKKSIEAGMNGHIAKPIDPDQLFATLQKWIKPVAERAAVPKSSSASGGPQTLDAIAEPDQALPDEEALPGSLAGFDLAAGLSRLMGNKRLYRKLLVDFGANYRGVAGQIQETLETKDFKQTHSLVHNLKGLAGNLEATELHTAAVEMEELVKGQTAITTSKKELTRKFAKLEKAIHQALEAVQTLGLPAEEKLTEPSAEWSADLPEDLLMEIADRIKAAADMGDVIQIKSIAEELKSESDAMAPFCDELIRLADDFDFDGVQRFINR